jgi:hypothetical protein
VVISLDGGCWAGCWHDNQVFYCHRICHLDVFLVGRFCICDIFLEYSCRVLFCSYSISRVSFTGLYECFVLNILSHDSVTIDGVWIGN